MPHQLIVFNRYAALKSHAVIHADQTHRHGIEHFVTNHQSDKCVRQFAEPFDLMRVLNGAQCVVDGRVLLRLQGRGQLHDLVAHGDAAFGQMAQYIGGQSPRAGAEFEDARRFIFQQLKHFQRLLGQCCAEQRREQGCGDEIALLRPH